ncbi:MAG: hypothetical protein JNM94_05855 [Phycisphaerae bacterium]|nr:hypothetical protein [Phycisphaerae bacterium]
MPIGDHLLFLSDGGLPRPDWDTVAHRIDDVSDLRARRGLWTDAARAWLEYLADALPEPSEAVESEEVLLVLPTAVRGRESLRQLADRCVVELRRRLGALATFPSPGKIVVVCLGSENSYYDYIATYYDDGAHGGSGGVQIRSDAYPHIAMPIRDVATASATLAHEMVHMALADADLPQWIEEGLAQMFEVDMGGARRSLMTEREREESLDVWLRTGLEPLWDGSGFSSADGELQRASYDTAELMTRLLATECRPRWFGFDRRPVAKFMGFLADASAADAGDAALDEWFGRSKEDLARTVLGRHYPE